jgi:hypothetical protein
VAARAVELPTVDEIFLRDRQTVGAQCPQHQHALSDAVLRSSQPHGAPQVWRNFDRKRALAPSGREPRGSQS